MVKAALRRGLVTEATRRKLSAVAKGRPSPKRLSLLTAEFVMGRVDVGASGCWVWRGSKLQASGYGRIKMSGRSYVAHRAVYEAMVGPVPDGLQLDHLCRNRLCVNPDHLEPVTGRVNVLRGETVVRANFEKTECVNGHPLRNDNVIMVRGGRSRRCKACHEAYMQEYRCRPQVRARRAAAARDVRARAKEQK